ncbi:N-6 DNA methylase [Mucilaginibacter sp. HC2]|uniref:Eco57I restriction-modification methylase domain-containing protein n=1 Tax=Mucilaginibacter inviolabilis TaxID=2714892 RepID=UPI00140AD3EE|nr:N-6 DNA methylase [Mucilaginibacter inviolabilis]NHA07717.1 N-6 DNA methylase [Mucilaginibacter inviolabilis]
MSSKKTTGSYYTPDHISGFILNYLAKDLRNKTNLSILEPSVGDGAFVKAFNESKLSTKDKSIKFTGIDFIEPELLKAKKASAKKPKKNTTYEFICTDFLETQKQLTAEYQLIVGNPPYISKKLLTKKQVDFCGDIHVSAGLSTNSIKNIWSAFLIRCCQLLSDDGILSFILPAEMLQVSFANELRSFVSNVFIRVEIFTFNELLFDCKGQDTILLIGYKQHINPGQYYTHISDINDLLSNKFKMVKNQALNTNNTKWSHHMLDSKDLDFLYNIASTLHEIDYYCESKPGIVTAANNFFIINNQTEDQYHLNNYTHPIIQKGLFVNGSVVFNEDDFEHLQQQGRPTKVLVFNDNNSGYLTDKIQDYLKIGEELEIPLRYKCTKRKTWYHIPNISNIPEGFFFKRSHNYPKLLKNNANVLVTDSAYKIQMRDGFAINNLVYSFYNSFTLLFAELEGRYYGGGVLELIPKEFQNLPLPYVNISVEGFNNFSSSFERKNTILDVLTINDQFILGESLGLSLEAISKIQLIYKKLISKRLRY